MNSRRLSLAIVTGLAAVTILAGCSQASDALDQGKDAAACAAFTSASNQVTTTINDLLNENGSVPQAIAKLTAAQSAIAAAAGTASGELKTNLDSLGSTVGDLKTQVQDPTGGDASKQIDDAKQQISSLTNTCKSAR